MDNGFPVRDQSKLLCVRASWTSLEDLSSSSRLKSPRKIRLDIGAVEYSYTVAERGQFRLSSKTVGDGGARAGLNEEVFSFRSHIRKYPPHSSIVRYINILFFLGLTSSFWITNSTQLEDQEFSCEDCSPTVKDSVPELCPAGKTLLNGLRLQDLSNIPD